MATKLGDMAVGSTVKIKVDGTAKDFIIVQQGKPSSSYDNSCNGTWLLMKYIYGTGKQDKIPSYLNSTFLNQIDADIREKIKQVTIPGGVSGKIFLLSTTETSIRSGYAASAGDAVLAYFEGCRSTSADSTRVAYFGGSAYAWWLRSFDYMNDGWGLYVDKNGDCGHYYSSNSYGIRPALILPSTLFVLDDGTITENQPPEVTSDSGASGAELGEKNAPFTVGYTVTDKDGDLMTVTEKLDGKTTKTRTGVASGTALTFEQAADAAGFQRILNGSHTLTLEVDDGKTTTEWTATFTKNVHAASVTLAEPLTVEGDITVAVLQVTGSIPDDAVFRVEVTNNAKDAAPVWQDATTDVQKGVNIAFENKTATAGAAFNFRVSVERGASGEGGYIEAVSGAFQ